MLRIKYDLHSIKKRMMSVKEYVAKIYSTCALLEAFRSMLPEGEKLEIILVGLLSGYDAILTLASFSNETLPLQKLIDMHLEFESW